MKNPIQNARIVGCDIEPTEYHRKDKERGDPQFSMTRSELLSFAACPARWRGGFEDESDTAATVWGSLIDTLILSEVRVKDRYAVAPETYTNEKGEVKPWNWNANVCKTWRDERGDIEIVKADVMAHAVTAAKRLLGDPALGELVGCSKRQMMVVADYGDEQTGLLIPIKTLIDLVPDKYDEEFGKSLADLKTARNASPGAWRRACFQSGYHIQAALNLDLFNAATDEGRNKFRHVIQENVFPWQTARRIVSAEFIELGRAAYQSALAFYAWCMKEKTWPGYDDTNRNLGGWTITQPEQWMLDTLTQAAVKPYEDPAWLG